MKPSRKLELLRDKSLQLTMWEIRDGYFFCCDRKNMLMNKRDLAAAECRCLKEGKI